MLIKTLVAISIVSMLLLPVTESPQTPRFDLIIKRGRIVDGTGRPGYVADVGIKDDRIERIGNLSQFTATERSMLKVSSSRPALSTCSASQVERTC